MHFTCSGGVAVVSVKEEAHSLWKCHVTRALQTDRQTRSSSSCSSSRVQRPWTIAGSLNRGIANDPRSFCWTCIAGDKAYIRLHDALNASCHISATALLHDSSARRRRRRTDVGAAAAKTHLWINKDHILHCPLSVQQ